MSNIVIVDLYRQNYCKVCKVELIPVKRIQTKWGSIPVDCVKEYDNPKSKELYQLAMQTKDIKERIAILSQLGHYQIIDNSVEKLKNKILQCELP